MTAAQLSESLTCTHGKAARRPVSRDSVVAAFMMFSSSLSACAPNQFAGIPVTPAATESQLQALARQVRAGDKNAQVALAIRYETGDGVQANKRRALELCQAATSGRGGMSLMHVPASRKGGRRATVPISKGPKIVGLAEARERCGRMLKEAGVLPGPARLQTLAGRLTDGPDIGVDSQICRDARRYYANYFGTKTVDCRAYAHTFLRKKFGRPRLLYSLSIDIDAEASEAMSNDGYGLSFPEGTSVVGPNFHIVREECGRFRVRDMVIEGRRYPIIIGILNEDGELVTGYVGKCSDD